MRTQPSRSRIFATSYGFWGFGTKFTGAAVMVFLARLWQSRHELDVPNAKVASTNGLKAALDGAGVGAPQFPDGYAALATGLGNDVTVVSIEN